MNEINDLSDVKITSATAGEFLKYNSALDLVNVSGASVGEEINLGDLADTNTGGIITDNALVSWDGSTSKFIISDWNPNQFAVLVSNNQMSGVNTFDDNSIFQGGISSDTGISCAGKLTVASGISCDGGATFGGVVIFHGAISADAGMSLAGAVQVPDDSWVGGGYNEERFEFNTNGNQIACRSVNLDIERDLRHYADHDTFFRFNTDKVGMYAGGVTFAYGYSGDFVVDKGMTVSGHMIANGGISANAGISTASGIQFSDGSIATSYTDTIGVYVSNGTKILTTGTKGRRVIPYDCEVVEWIVSGSTAGSITWDINWGTTSAWPNALASVGFSGDGSPPQLGATASQSHVLIPTAWTKSGFSAGDIIQFEIDSISTITDCELSLKIKRTL